MNDFSPWCEYCNKPIPDHIVLKGMRCITRAKYCSKRCRMVAKNIRKRSKNIVQASTIGGTLDSKAEAS